MPLSSATRVPRTVDGEGSQSRPPVRAGLGLTASALRMERGLIEVGCSTRLDSTRLDTREQQQHLRSARSYRHV